MKMSDVFEGLPVSIDESGDCHYFLQDKTDKLYGANCGEFYGEAIGRAAAHAINNHDRMMEEIAELRVVLRLLIGKGIDLLNVEDVSDEEDAASVHANFNDAIIKSEQLLAKLNQEREE